MKKSLILTQSIILLIFFACISNNNRKECTRVLEMILDQYPMYVKVSPNGNKILLKNRCKETFELLTSDIPVCGFNVINTSHFTQLSLTWHPNGSEVIFQELNPKTRKYALYRVDINSKKRTLIGLPASTNAVPPLRWSKTGKYLAYLATDRLTNLYIYDYKKKEIKNIFPYLSLYSDFQWLGDSIISMIENPKRPILKQINLITNEICEYSLLKFEEVNKFSIIGKNVLFIGREPNNEYFQCYQLNLENSTIKQMTDKNYNVSSCRYTNNGSIFYYNRNENGVNKLYCSDSTINSYIQGSVKSQGNLLINLEQNSELYVAHQSFNYPTELLKFDVTKHIKDVIYSHDLKTHLRLEEPVFLEISRENSKFNIPCYLWKTNIPGFNDKSVIYVHGGPFGQSEPLWNIRAKLLNDYGFNVLSINYHGSSGYSKEFAQEKDELVQVLDIVESIKFLKNKYHVKEENIILLGSSFGGKLVLKAINYFNNIGGVVLISGIITDDIDLQKLKKTKLYGFYGEMDPLSLRAYDFFRGSDLIYHNSENLNFLKKEGHIFHKSSSWASVYCTIIETFSDLNKD